MSSFTSFVVVCCLFVVKLNVVGANTCAAKKDCSEFEYCSKFDQKCTACEDVCTETNNHNQYDINICERECQKYLQNQSKGGILAEVQTLRTLVSISLALNCIIILFLISVAAFKFLQLKKKGVNIAWLRNKLKTKEKSKSERPTVSVTTASGKPDLRLDMPPLGHQSPTPNGNTPSTATTTLSRRPTEDNTLDYAYDNPAMRSTPSPNAKPHESTL